MSDNFSACLIVTLGYEGGFVNNPADPGGATNLGITRATLAAWRKKPVSAADVRALTREEAAHIYRANYWNAVGADRLPRGVDLMAFDIAVNMGVGRARTWLAATVKLSPAERIAWLGARRLTFWRSLKTWRVFGRGWTARGEAVVRAAFAMQRGASRVA